MSRHEGVSCDNCLKTNFSEKRYKCLVCFDYDLCEACYEYEVEASNHLASHPMQCILTRRDFGRFYGGESITQESPPALVCPFCGKLGLTDTSLLEHVANEHVDDHTSVVCPACAVMPSGDPNLVTNDLAQHLTVDHHLSQDNQDSNANRTRRRGVKTRIHRNPHSSNGTGGGTVIVQNNNSVSSISIRDSMDPIAELLSQLSGVRRSAHEVGQNVATASHLRELQAQLQMERQQLERLPSKLQGNSSAAQNPGQGAASKTVTQPQKTANARNDDDDSRFLLSKIDMLSLSESEKQERERNDVERSHFVQELLLSMLSTDDSSNVDHSSNQPDILVERTPLRDEPFLTPLPNSIQPTSSLKPKVVTLGEKNCLIKIRIKSPTQNDELAVPSHSESTNSRSDENLHHNNQSSDAPIQPALVMRPLTGAQTQNLNPQQRHYPSNVEKHSDDDDLRPPSPRQQSRGLRLQNRIYAPMALAGGSSTAPLPRDVATAESIVKHIH